jgi:ElaA protein
MTKWILKKFDDLTPHELYSILQLRNEVFVVEQNCVYQDADDKDRSSYHFTGWINDRPIAYARLLPKGAVYEDYVSIGRVVVSPSARGTGIGKELIQRSIEQANTLFGTVPIKIGAQIYLKIFYSEFGFQQTSDIYLEDGIEHIEMIRYNHNTIS